LFVFAQVFCTFVPPLLRAFSSLDSSHVKHVHQERWQRKEKRRSGGETSEVQEWY
jgi:hypothetical protein